MFKALPKGKFRIIGIILLLFVYSLLITPHMAVGQEKKPKYTLKLAAQMAPDHPHPRGFNYFAERVKEYTNGEVQIQVFPSGQLGGASEVMLGMQTGTIQMAKGVLSFATQFVPEVKIFDLPYLFENREHLYNVLDGPIGKKFDNEIFPKYGLVGFFFIDDGARSIYSNKIIRTPQDMKGLKIRVMPSDVMVDSINAMGGIATPMAWGEIFTGLEQHTIDGAENSGIVLYTSKHYEVAKVFSLTEQFWCVISLLGSKKTWDSLPPEIQGEIRKAADAAKWYTRYIYKADEEIANERLKKAGVKIIADVDQKAFREAVKPVYDKFTKKYGSDLLNQIRGMAK